MTCAHIQVVTMYMYMYVCMCYAHVYGRRPIDHVRKTTDSLLLLWNKFELCHCTPVYACMHVYMYVCMCVCTCMYREYICTYNYGVLCLERFCLHVIIIIMKHKFNSPNFFVSNYMYMYVLIHNYVCIYMYVRMYTYLLL